MKVRELRALLADVPDYYDVTVEADDYEWSGLPVDVVQAGSGHVAVRCV